MRSCKSYPLNSPILIHCAVRAVIPGLINTRCLQCREHITAERFFVGHLLDSI